MWPFNPIPKVEKIQAKSKAAAQRILDAAKYDYERKLSEEINHAATKGLSKVTKKTDLSDLMVEEGTALLLDHLSIKFKSRGYMVEVNPVKKYISISWNF